MASTTTGYERVNIRGGGITKSNLPACRSMIATAKPMVNPERAAEWSWVPIPHILKAPGNVSD